MPTKTHMLPPPAGGLPGAPAPPPPRGRGGDLADALAPATPWGRVMALINGRRHPTMPPGAPPRSRRPAALLRRPGHTLECAAVDDFALAGDHHLHGPGARPTIARRVAL